jgi:hypothetical protein
VTWKQEPLLNFGCHFRVFYLGTTDLVDQDLLIIDDP